jgi:Mg2+-importing ATPase
MATLLVVVVTIVFPITPLAEPFGFQPVPITILLAIGIIVVFHIIAAEMTKRSFYKRVEF